LPFFGGRSRRPAPLELRALLQLISSSFLFFDRVRGPEHTSSLLSSVFRFLPLRLWTPLLPHESLALPSLDSLFAAVRGGGGLRITVSKDPNRSESPHDNDGSARRNRSSAVSSNFRFLRGGTAERGMRDSSSWGRGGGFLLLEGGAGDWTASTLAATSTSLCSLDDVQVDRLDRYSRTRLSPKSNTLSEDFGLFVDLDGASVLPTPEGVWIDEWPGTRHNSNYDRANIDTKTGVVARQHKTPRFLRVKVSHTFHIKKKYGLKCVKNILS